jgi:hypothetical protein
VKYSCSVLSILYFCWSYRCRRGSAELLINFDDHWPSNISLSSQESSRLLESVETDDHKICGKEVPRGYWVCPLMLGLMGVLSWTL